MIALFRLNDPYRLIFVLLALIGLRIPFFMEELIPTVTAFRWMLIGEQLSGGDILYKEVYDYIGPLAGGVFQGFDLLFGRSLQGSMVLAAVLVFIQAVIFNNLLLINKAYSEGTYIPAYCYVLFTAFHFDFLTLSPALLALTFVLLALSNIFKRIDNQTKDELFMGTGIYLGIASLLYLPCVVLFFTFLVILVVFSNSLPRRLMLMTVGFLLMLMLAASYAYFMEALGGFLDFYLYSLWKVERLNYFGNWKVILILVFPFLLVATAMAIVYLKGKYANFQLKFIQAQLFLLAGCGLMMLVTVEKAYFSWIFMMPIVAFFMVHLFLLIRNVLYQESLNLSIIVILVLLRGYSYDYSLQNEAKYFVQQEAPVILHDRKLLVLGNDITAYQKATTATPFVNWTISQQLFTETAYYDNLIRIKTAIDKDTPEMIVDLEGVMEEVFVKIPALQKQFAIIPGYPGYYRRVSN